MKQEDLDNWFSYHSPSLGQMSAYTNLRNLAKQFAEQFNVSVPDCADKTAAIRNLRETVMAMNLAIACNTPGDNEGTQSNLITAKLVSHDATSKEKVLARFPQAYVTSSPKFPAMVSLYTNVGDYYLNATDEQTAWDHMADVIDKETA